MYIFLSAFAVREEKPTNLVGAEAAAAGGAVGGGGGGGGALAAGGGGGGGASGGGGGDSLMMNNGNRDTSNTDVQKLQEQLNDIKEQVGTHISREFRPPLGLV